MKFRNLAKLILNNFLLVFGVKLIKLHSMEKIVNKLSKKKVKINNLNALELFAGYGSHHINHYGEIVKSLELWEIDPKCQSSLEFLYRRCSNLKVKITDSFSEMRSNKNKYDFIVVDNPLIFFGDKSQYCEHFDVFPDIFKITSNESIICINIIHEPTVLKKNINRLNLLTSKHQDRRNLFYENLNLQDDNPKSMINHYVKIANANNYEVIWSFIEPRDFLYYLVFKIKKK